MQRNLTQCPELYCKSTLGGGMISIHPMPRISITF